MIFNMDKIELIRKAKEAYYNTGEPIMSDQEYDLLVREVGEVEVGAPVLDSLKKIDISDRPMLSLDKCHTVEEVKSFASGKDVVASIKCDGLSVRIIYENGKIVSANTRGDGEVGADITEHIKQFKNVPKTIDYAGRLIVDGEAVILQHDFDEINAGGQFKNPRNLAAGTLASLDTSLCRTRKLSFIAWDLIEPRLDLYNAGLNFLEDQCFFDIVPWQYCLASSDNYTYENINNKIMKIAKEHGVPCDGVVWKFNDIAYGESLGRTAHHFLNGIAWKPAITEVETTLIDIEWSMGRTGVLTPVAIFEPVELLGSTIERASLHNLSISNEVLGIHPYQGQKIKVFKANEIIPQLSWADKENVDYNNLIKCTSCPICGGDLEVKDNDGVITVYCANPECDGKISKKIEHYCSRDKGLDIRGLSIKTIEKLIDLGWLNEIKDLYSLEEHKKDWIKLEGFGEKSVQNILDAIETSKTTTLDKFISALGIPLVGRTIGKELAKLYPTWNDFRQEKNWSKIGGIGYEMEKALNSFNYAEADLIAEQYLVFEEIKTAPASNTVKGMTFVITGKLSRKRDDIKADIEAAGGKVGSSVTGKTNYLVCNQPEDTTKYHAAEDKGIPIITEEQLMEMIK